MTKKHKCPHEVGFSDAEYKALDWLDRTVKAIGENAKSKNRNNAALALIALEKFREQFSKNFDHIHVLEIQLERVLTEFESLTAEVRISDMVTDMTKRHSKKHGAN